MDHETLIIVGAGLVGASTALEAITKYHTVYLIDDPRPSINPASKGPGRIVRAAYGENEEYSRLALKSIEQIKRGPLNRFFHESERVVLQPGGTGPTRRTFRDVKFDELQGTSDDQPAGWIEAAKSLEHTVEMARERGVIFTPGRVVGLSWDDGVCSGVQMDDGTKLGATSVLLAMGYKVPEFLARQGKRMEDGLCKTVIVPWGHVELNLQQYEELKNKPITIVPGVGEYLPPNEDRILWVNNARTVEVTDLQRVEQAYLLGEGSPYYQETHDLLCWFLPELKDAPFTLHYCSELITTKQHFLIRPVPECKGLYIGCGLSFHGFKFIGILGKYTVAMMKGEIAFSEYQKLWSGALDGMNEVHPEVMPHREFPEGEL